MSMERNIIIVNEFTNTKNASRGSTPGAYVTNYVARDNGVEAMYPLQHNEPIDGRGLSSYITHYTGRSAATESAIELYQSPNALKQEIRRNEAADGRTFGGYGLSYTSEEMHAEADRIQACFDEGHTVMKTVVSFDTDYLKKQGVLPDTFEHRRTGDFAGHVDQLKLRRAISAGMDDMLQRGGFDKPVWVGAIQIDTHHVHAHMTLAESGDGSARHIPSGEERGKLNSTERTVFRRGIHRSLRQDATLKSLHTQVDETRKEAVSQTRRLVFSQIESNARLQQLVASLPKDKKKWRYGSNAKEMRHPNALALAYVDSLRNTHDSVIGYTRAVDAVDAYRTESEVVNDLSVEESDEVKQKGEELLQERIVNGIYKQLKQQIKEGSLSTSTSLLAVQAHDTDELRVLMGQNLTNARHGLDVDNSNMSNMAATAFRMASYQERLQEHVEDAVMYYDAVTDFEARAAEGHVSTDALAMRHFYETEQKYHMDVADKYRHFYPDTYRQSLAGFDSHSPEKMREGLESKYDALRVQEGERHRPPAEALSMYALEVSHDIRLRDTLQQSEVDGISLADHIKQVVMEPSKPMPTDVMIALNRLYIRDSPHGHIGSQLAERQENVRLEHYHRTSGDEDVFHVPLRSREEQAITHYVAEFRTVQMRAWVDGRVSSEDAFLPAAKREAIIKGEEPLPVVPEWAGRDHRLDKQDAHYNHVKSHDLHDVLYDFSPLTSRKVGRKSAHQYKEVTTSRADAVDNAVDYMQETAQYDVSLMQLQTQLRAYRQLAEIIEEDEELPYPEDYAEQAHTVASIRYLSSIDLDTSHDLTRRHIQTSMRDSTQFKRAVDSREGEVVSALHPVQDDIQPEVVEMDNAIYEPAISPIVPATPVPKKDEENTREL